MRCRKETGWRAAARLALGDQVSASTWLGAQSPHSQDRLLSRCPWRKQKEKKVNHLVATVMAETWTQMMMKHHNTGFNLNKSIKSYSLGLKVPGYWSKCSHQADYFSQFQSQCWNPNQSPRRKKSLTLQAFRAGTRPSRKLQLGLAAGGGNIPKEGD